MQLADKTAIVTGAASGIGQGTAVMMAREGARVVAVDINAEGLDQTLDEFRRDGGQATACVADVARDDDVRQMIHCAVDTYGGLHVLHNNAYWHMCRFQGLRRLRRGQGRCHRHHPLRRRGLRAGYPQQRGAAGRHTYKGLGRL